MNSSPFATDTLLPLTFFVMRSSVYPLVRVLYTFPHRCTILSFALTMPHPDVFSPPLYASAVKIPLAPGGDILVAD